MPPAHVYAVEQPARSQIDALIGPAVLDFGTNWCGHCRAARPLVDAALAAVPQVSHVMVEDGKGRALGRSFGVTLWPTLIFLRDGVELARLVRPTRREDVAQALLSITVASAR